MGLSRLWLMIITAMAVDCNFTIEAADPFADTFVQSDFERERLAKSRSAHSSFRLPPLSVLAASRRLGLKTTLRR